MPSRKSIPKTFKSPEDAGKFWDDHSAADYWDEMEEEELEFNIVSRSYEIPVDEQIYQLAKHRAEKEHRSIQEVIDTTLRRALAG